MSITAKNDLPNFIINHTYAIGIFAVLVCAGTWLLDYTELVYACPYCRVQRTIIGLLGIIILLPLSKSWIGKYIATVLAFFGMTVAALQHFRGWAKVSAGEFKFNQTLMTDPTILSGLSMFFIAGLLFVIIHKNHK